MVEGVLGQIIDGQWWLLGMKRGNGFLVCVIHGTVFRVQRRATVAGIVRMGETKVDQERVFVPGLLAILQVVQDLLSVPGAAVGIVGSIVGAVMPDGEFFIGSLVAVALLTRAHGVIASSIEDGGHGEIGQAWRDAFRIGNVWIEDPPGFVRDVPDSAATHDHVTRRRADATGPGSHVMGGVKDHSLLGKTVDGGRLQSRIRVVRAEIERRLIISNDEENVGALPRCLRGRQEDQRKERGEDQAHGKS